MPLTRSEIDFTLSTMVFVMSVQHTNRKSKTYYLHQGKTKTGKPRYYFSMKDDGNLAEELPDGYEIHEHPASAQVFLRKVQARIITDIEKHLIGKHLRKLTSSRRYVFDIKGKVITIFESDQYVDDLRELFNEISNPGSWHAQFTVDSFIDRTIDYFPVMRFTLDDESRRTFLVERYSFRGSTEDWIYIDGPDALDDLLDAYSKHLGEESFYDLYGL